MKNEVSEKTINSRFSYNLFIGFFICLVLITGPEVFADNLTIRLNKPYAPNPNAADLGRFSAVPVGLFTGTANYSILLYEFKTTNLSVPLTLEYSSNGLIVDRISSWVGFDWTLNSGGVINRYRKGRVDRPGARPTYPSNWSSMTIEQKKNYLDLLLISSDNDLEPDEFTFSFLGYSGKFIIDESGVIRLIPFRNLIVETNASGTYYSYFKITTPDGISYLFDKVGWTRPNNEPSYTSSYYLTQIKHPDGEVVNFTYTTNTGFLQYNGVSQTATTVVQQSYNSLPPVSLNELNTGVNPFYSDAVFPDKIIFPNIGSIEFVKSNTTRLDSYGDYELTRIKVLDNNNNLIKSFQFFHEFPTCSSSYKSKTNLGISEPNSEHEKRMFLDSVQVQTNTSSKISSYIFQYNNLSQLPARFSFSQDHWGYFNGKVNSDFAIITEVPTNYRGLFANMIPTTANRSPDYLYAQKGMLKKVIFPTRGYSTIEYEPHKDNSNNILGGCRVLRTKTYDSPTSTTPVVKKYVYSSSQKSLNYKYYTEYFTYRFNPGIDGSATYGKLSSNSFYNLSVCGLYHILYSNVEVWSGENAENGKEVHYYIIDIDAAGTPWNLTISDAMIYPLVTNNTGWKTGLEASSSLIENSSITMSSNTYSYNFTETRNYKDVSCLAVEKFYNPNGVLGGSSSSIQPYKVIGYDLKSVWTYINQEVVTRYSPSGNVVSTKSYSYNDYGLMSSETLIASDGTTIETKTRWPSDINTGLYSQMKTKNMNYPVETVSLKNNNVTGSSLTTYKINGTSYVPDKLYKLEFTVPFPVSSFTFFNGSARDSRYASTPEVSYDAYNTANGNLRQITSRDGITTAWLWDLYGNYLMAEINGAAYTQVSSLDGKAISYESKDLWTGLNSLVPDALINTYGYYPLTGLKNATDPKGTTTKYEYDTFARLKLVRNDDNHLVRLYKYNYIK